MFSLVTHHKSLHAGCSPLTVCSSVLTLWQTHRVTFGHPSTSSWCCWHPCEPAQGWLTRPARSQGCAASHALLFALQTQTVSQCCIFILVISSLTLPWPLHYELRLLGYASCLPPKTSQKTCWSRANRSHQFVPTSLSPYLSLSSTAVRPHYLSL